MTAPACARCNQVDRMRSLPSTVTDYGGMVHVWVCQRCGIVAVATQGERGHSAGERCCGAGAPGSRQGCVDFWLDAKGQPKHPERLPK